MRHFILVIVMVTLSVTAYAKDNFSGYFDIGILGASSTDALMVSSNNEKIDNLSDSPDRFNNGVIYAQFDLKYKSNNLTYHAGTPFGGGKPEFEIGLSMDHDYGKCDISIILDPFGKVWEDPYVLDRDGTTDRAVGIKFTHEGIGGTPHLAILKITNHNIGDDVIGERYSSMKRDGYSYDFSVGYDFNNDKGKLTPFVGITYDNRDGEAQENKGAYIKFVDLKMLSSGMLISAISLDYQKYSAENPIFNNTREDIKAGAFTSYRWMNPFGLKKKHISFMAGVSSRMSNIDFYDATSLVGGVTFGFDF
ncbi:MAG: hypothetical protein C0603_10210 [Denitrovibrio sp.]|nr:MAG: hypothetical protein C0603_10210 [Denitrovibrio sp.]